MTGPVLRLRGVRRTFEPASDAPVRALRGVDLEVAAGEFVALTGPSGSGKSTLLQVACGLDRADDGEVELGGTRLDGLSEDDRARVRRRSTGLVLQSPALLDGLTVLENVALAALAAGASRREARERAREQLDLLGLLGRAGSPPASLSGGQRSRVAVARALVARPLLLLADEPTGALDSAGTDEVLELLGRLHADGLALLVVTHSEQVAAAASRRLRLRDGALEGAA